MSIGTALVAGAIIGIRHALESDHVAAVATLLEGDRERPGLVGISWGLGHTVPIAVLGLSFFLLGFRLPPSVTALFELVVGIVLILLGGRMLLEAADVTGHVHGSDGGHTHLHLGGLALGRSHHHFSRDALAVGVIHGIAGSGALVIAMAAESPTFWTAAAFLAAFGILSTATMGIVSLVWGRSLATPFRTGLKLVAGTLGIFIGVVLLLGQAGVPIH